MLEQVYKNYNKEKYPYLRLGQYFINCYIKNPWPELYYEEDPIKAGEMIQRWLDEHHYITTLPIRIERK